MNKSLIPFPPQEFFAVKFSSKYKKKVFLPKHLRFYFPKLNIVKSHYGSSYCSLNWVKNQFMVIFIFVTRHGYAWLHESEQRRVNMHSILKHLNTVDNKKCKYAMHIVMFSSFEQTSRSDNETQIKSR